jgi:hypothetical protein
MSSWGNDEHSYNLMTERIHLGQVERVVAVDQARMTHDDQVKPTASPPSASSHTILPSDLLQVVTRLL